MGNEQTALVPAGQQQVAVSQSYDQNDNAYKNDDGAQAVVVAEREREDERQKQEEQRALVKYNERMEREERRKEENERRKREREAAEEAEEEEEYQEKMRRAKHEAEVENREREMREKRAQRDEELEREQEILKRQQDARDLRQRKKREQQQRTVDEEYERERQKKKAEDDALFSKKYGKATANVNEAIHGGIFDNINKSAENYEKRKRFNDYPRSNNVNDAINNIFGKQQTEHYHVVANQHEHRRAHETFFGGMFFDAKEKVRGARNRTAERVHDVRNYFGQPGLGGRLARSIDRGAGRAYQRGKFHMQRSWNDSFLVPMGAVDAQGRRAQRRAQVPRFVQYGGNVLYGLPGSTHGGLVPRGKMPTGLLFSAGRSMQAPAGRFLLFGRAPPKRRSKGRGKRSRSKASNNARFLDRLLYF